MYLRSIPGDCRDSIGAVWRLEAFQRSRKLGMLRFTVVALLSPADLIECSSKNIL